MMLRDKVSIITGASMGIGKGIAQVFLAEGCRCVLVARGKAPLETAREELSGIGPRVAAFPGDVSDEDTVRALVEYTLEEFGAIDILVNNAGVYGPIGLITDVDSQRWWEAVRINLFGAFLCSKHVIGAMIKQGRGGKIINLGGGGASGPFPRFSAYAASKVAIVRLTETLAEEVREYRIDVNAIAPGPVNTRLLDQVLQAGEASGRQFFERSLKQKVEGGTSHEVVGALAVVLASQQSDGLAGRYISAVWDNWREIVDHLPEIMGSELYTLRRVSRR